ncbi:probable disease resistance protein At4g27220 isoform X2 [Neltuma alba]|nr:probable disease resistance protein At4g27220 isoform X2 [Prosopis alba]XP_028786979.1 probable disease resistance protein At4g27220 isoform X2 [Prosopis alba]
MDDAGISAAAKLAEYLVDPTLHQLQYLFCVGKITRNVETKKEELILKQGRVQELVEEAIKRTERIDDEVNKWMNEVVSLIAEVESSVQELKANNNCFQRWCPTWRRYHLCKVLVKTAQQMTELNAKSDQLEPFSHHVIVPDIEYHSSKDFMVFRSTEMAYDELWEALQDSDSFIIGLWGMGGSGKTTLVKEVGKKSKESKLFDRVIITTISQTPNIRKSQGEIADLLGLELREESEAGRARRIAMKLQSPKEQILIILDDVWSMLNLEDIGNPFRNEGPRNCKVLFTTRRKEVCTLMDCQKTISLGLLTKDEAWDLFQTHAKVDDGAIEVAQEVAMECKGLPIAIVAMGKCLKGKGLDEINVVLHRLRHSKPVVVDEGGSDAYACLKLSYNYLKTVEAKLLFLICALFPEDHEIIIEDLFRYGIGLGLCKDADSFEIGRSQVIASIYVLIDSSLLTYYVNSWNEKCVKMHDMVRDVALWIAPKELGTIMVNCAKEFNGLHEDEAAKDCYAISSWNRKNEVLRFPSQLDAPKLELMLINSSKPIDLSRASFEGVKGLKVVALNNNGPFYLTKLLPQSIQWLSNLRTLRLRDWDLGDISFVVSLKRLEILDLKGSRFKKLPNGIENLIHLKLLDLSWCIAEECFYKAIGRCSQLEELYAYIIHPSRCTICYECFVGVPALSKLGRYTLEMGPHNKTMFQNKGIREIFFAELNISIPSAMIKDLAQRAIAIEFYKLQGGCKRFSPDVVQTVGGMNELTKLCLQHCCEIECFTDQTTPHEDIVVLRLVELVLKYMDNLKQLCYVPSNVSLFLNLESLNIESCPQLVNVFPGKCNLGNLKYLNIVNCPMLTSLFPISVACTLLSLEQLSINECHELKHVIEGEDGIVDAWEDPMFPKWEILSVWNCNQLESICPSFCVQGFTRLKSIFIKDAPQLKFVFGEATSICDGMETSIVLPLLENFRLENLPNLLRIYPESYHLLWPSLMKAEWTNCPKIEYFI